MTADALPRRTGLRAEILALQIVVGAFAALRLYFHFNGEPLGDEAYYWMWGQHLGWSYFDHPPLHAWLLRAVAELFGWQLFNIRLLTWLSLAGIFAIVWDWSRRIAPDDPGLWFWRAAAILLASPMFFGFTMIAYNDHLLVLFSLLAIHCFVLFADKTETGAAGSTRWLYAAALALGLAMLAKYNAVLVGAGLALAFVIRPKLRPLLITPHPWLAALLAIAMQAPVIWWNLTVDLASLRYHLDDRWGGGAWTIHWTYPLTFLLLTALVWSPFLIWPLLRLLTLKRNDDFEGRATGIATTIFLVTTLFFVAISLFLGAYYYWNIVAFAALMPLLPRVTQSAWLRWSHIAFGLVAAALAVFNFSIMPLANLSGGTDNGSAINFGWHEVADKFRAAQAAHPADLVAATRYSTTSQLGFALGTTDAVKLSPEHSQYDYWQAGLPLAGKSALILTDERDGSGVIDYLHAHFATLEPVDAIEIVRLGKIIYRWRIFHGEGYIPERDDSPAP